MRSRRFRRRRRVDLLSKILCLLRAMRKKKPQTKAVKTTGPEGCPVCGFRGVPLWRRPLLVDDDVDGMWVCGNPYCWQEEAWKGPDDGDVRRAVTVQNKQVAYCRAESASALLGLLLWGLLIGCPISLPLMMWLAGDDRAGATAWFVSFVIVLVAMCVLRAYTDKNYERYG